MSAKPYIVQQDSPNLVIVPTETYYEPPPKKVKQDIVQNLPTPTKKLDNSAFTKKTAAKFNYSHYSSINNDVLIDVSKVKKPPASWASNYLQSIGGSSPKLARLYSTAPKLSLSRKENTELSRSGEIILQHTTNNLLNTNTVEIQTIMDKEKSLPKINLNLINPKQKKPAPQAVPLKVSQTRKPEVYTKENSQPHINTKTYQSKSDTTTKTNQAQVRKEPSLPKGYRIPIQSKNKKKVSEPIVDINPTRPNTLKESDQVNHNAKCQDTDQPKCNKPATQDMSLNKESTLFKRIKATNNVKINKTETHQDKDSIKRIKLINEFHAKKIDELKAKNTTSQLRIKKDKPKHNEEVNQSKRNKETTHSKTYKENNQFKNDDKETKQRKTKEINLPRSYKNPCPPEYHKEITSRKSNKESTPAKITKTVSKQNNKKEATYYTKLKTKKFSEISKSTKHNKSKHALESESKRHKNHAELNTKGNLPKTINESVKESPLKTSGTVLSKKENILKLKKSSTEKYNNENKKYTQNETNAKKIKMSKSNSDERSSTSLSPIKSVVTKPKTDHNIHDKERRYHKESDFHSHDNETSGQDFNYNSHKNNSKKYLDKESDVDLRAKLKRKITKNGHQEDQNWDRGNKKNKFATVPNGDRFVPEENLIISFDAKDDNEEVTTSLFTENKMAPNKKLARKKSAGGKKCKKIKLEINIVFDHADTTDEESINSEEDETNTEIAENADFSFLDDFNVDEIVKSLNECKDSSKNDNSEVQLTVNDAKAKGFQTNDSKANYIEAVATSQCNALTNNNETKSETAYPNIISSVENKTNEYKEMESPPEVTQTRHHKEIDIKLKADEDGVKNVEQAEHVQDLAVLNDAMVKKEEGINTKIEGNTKSHVNDNSPNWEGQTASLALVVANLSSEHIMDLVKTEVDISQETDLSQTKNSRRIEVQISSNEDPIEMSTTENISQSDLKNTIPMDISRDSIINDSGQDSVLNEPTFTKMNNNIELVKENIINDDSEVTSKIDNKDDTSTNDKTGVKQTSDTTVVEPNVIIILDSDDENETQIKNNKSTKNNCATALECSMESSIYVESDEVIILDATATENSEPILVLDTDHNVGVESSDGDDAKNQLNKIDKKFNTVNLTLADNEENAGIKIDAAGTTKRETTTLEDASTETKIKISAETKNINGKLLDDYKFETNNGIHSESRKTDCDDTANYVLSNPNETNEKIVVQTSKELPKSSENSHVVSEISTPEAIPPNAKPQNVNTKEVKVQYKGRPANSENINADEANEKTVIKTSEELPKSPEKFHVPPEKSIPKAVPPNTKLQNVITKEIKTENEESPANSDNINADEANEKTVIKTSEELQKPPENFQVAIEKSIPKAVPPNAKPQNANTKEVRAQDKETPVNSENINADEANKKTVIKTSEELQKSPEKLQVTPEKSISKAVPPNAKPQNGNTKEVKAQDKGSPANSENLNADEENKKTVIKTSEELPKSLEKLHVAPEKSIPKAVPRNTKPQNVKTKEVKAQDKESPANSQKISADEGNEKTVIKTSEELSKLPEKSYVAPEKSIPKAVTPNSKPQNVNTKEVKAQVKKSPANSENMHKVTKTEDINAKIEICRKIANDDFIRKLEAKLLSVMGIKYTITKLIRAGKFSKIYAGKDPALCDFAVKVSKDASNKSYQSCQQKENMIIELQNGVPEKNLNCVRLVKGFPVCAFWCFLMEYYPKNLAQVLNENNKSFHIDEVQKLSRQLVSAVTILRNNNIIHSDIKPSHILINASNTRIKLCGFDQASYFDGSKMFPNTGTVNYRAPELILGYPAAYGIDVWSTALVMYEMATNQKLFPGIFNNDILYKQLCTLGSVPMEMLMQSSYRKWHFKDTAFCRIIGAKKSIIIHKITGNDFLNNGLFQTYDKDWAKKKNPAVRLEDKSKLCAFSKLLHSMLAMFPKNRIAIEFVFANPFIYETFDNC